MRSEEMRILIVEDDEIKAKNIQGFVEELLPGAGFSLVKSFNSAIRVLRRDSFDLILMDMSLPTFDITATESGGQPKGFGGADILRNIERFELSIPTIVVTQYETLGAGTQALDIETLGVKLQKEYPAVFRGLVYYQAASTTWKGHLEYLITNAFQKTSS